MRCPRPEEGGRIGGRLGGGGEHGSRKRRGERRSQPQDEEEEEAVEADCRSEEDEGLVLGCSSGQRRWRVVRPVLRFSCIIDIDLLMTIAGTLGKLSHKGRDVD